jgi:hypothetical protein
LQIHWAHFYNIVHLFSVMYNLNFIDTSTAEQFCISSSDRIFIMYKAWFNISIHLFQSLIILKSTMIYVFKIWHLKTSLSTVFVQLILCIVLFAIRRSFTYTLIIMTVSWFFLISMFESAFMLWNLLSYIRSVNFYIKVVSIALVCTISSLFNMSSYSTDWQSHSLKCTCKYFFLTFQIFWQINDFDVHLM